MKQETKKDNNINDELGKTINKNIEEAMDLFEEYEVDKDVYEFVRREYDSLVLNFLFFQYLEKEDNPLNTLDEFLSGLSLRVKNKNIVEFKKVESAINGDNSVPGLSELVEFIDGKDKLDELKKKTDEMSDKALKYHNEVVKKSFNSVLNELKKKKQPASDA